MRADAKKGLPEIGKHNEPSGSKRTRVGTPSSREMPLAIVITQFLVRRYLHGERYLSRGGAPDGFADRAAMTPPAAGLNTLLTDRDRRVPARRSAGVWPLRCWSSRRRLAQTGHKGHFMFIIIAAVLVIAWLLGLTAFHVAGGLIHLLLILAVISIVIHFVRGRSAV
jgi:hypothetical protein